jgi:hypothetical protein
MRRIHNRTIIAVSALVLGLGSGVRWLYMAWNTVHENSVHGCYTSAHVTKGAELVCQRLMPETQFRFIEAECHLGFDGMHRPHRVWTAECTTDSGSGDVANSVGSGAFLKWDADNGKLVYISLNRGQRPNVPCALTAREAIRSSLHWLHALNMQEPNTFWRPLASPEKNLTAWIVHLQNSQQKATVKINVDDGSLQSALLWHYLQ